MIQPRLILNALLALTCIFSTVLAEGSQHTNNWAVLVSTSRFWFNYRHMANVLSMYRTVKRLGIPDSQIILMLSDDVSCNPRNAFPGTVYNNADRALDLYGDNVEVDYRGYEVIVENFIRLLTDRWDKDQPRSKRLLTDDRSNIFIYMTGHGGNEFLKFQDAEEIGAQDIADAFGQMWEKKRYNEILFMIDTCQANTMYSRFYSPNILAVGSSKLDQSSYSHHADVDVGVAVIDRFTYYNLEFLENIDRQSKTTIADLFASYNAQDIHSDPGIRADLFKRDLKDVLLTDFFGSVQHVEVDDSSSSSSSSSASLSGTRRGNDNVLKHLQVSEEIATKLESGKKISKEQQQQQQEKQIAKAATSPVSVESGLGRGKKEEGEEEGLDKERPSNVMLAAVLAGVGTILLGSSFVKLG